MYFLSTTTLVPSPTCFHHTPCLAAPILFRVKLPRIGRVLITQCSSCVLITKGLLCRLLVSLVLEKEKIVIVNSSMPSGIICFARSPPHLEVSWCRTLPRPSQDHPPHEQGCVQMQQETLHVQSTLGKNCDRRECELCPEPAIYANDICSSGV